MAILVTFTPIVMRTEQYDEVMRRLEAVGAGRPPGRLDHVAAGDPARLRVVDVWESPEAFEAFGQSLLPILKEVGVILPPPEITPVHRRIVE